MARTLASLRLVPLAAEHLEAVLEVERASQGSPWSEASFRNELDHQEGLFLVALLQGKPVGYGGIWIISDEAHVVNIAVHPDHRRGGIGWKLMIELLLRAQEKGATCSTLEVRESNDAAIRMYERLGYERCGVRKNYYPDNKEAAVIMWLHDLTGWEPPKA